MKNNVTFLSAGRDIDSDQIVYLVMRMDPHKVLPAGYDARRAP
jgi:hypothetical protein